MSASTQNIDLDEIARKLFILLSYRKSNTCEGKISINDLENIFENIYPYFQMPNEYVYYPPLPQLTPISFHFPWKSAYNIRVLNVYLKEDSNETSKTISVEVDSIIGEAIQNRIAKDGGPSDAKPNEFQMKAIAEALATLEPVRKYLRGGDIAGIKNFFSNGSLSPTVIGALAPTGSGKTEIFEVIALQLVLDSYVGALNKRDKSVADFTKAILVYPMKAFMIDHFRRFLQDVIYINNKFLNTNDAKQLGLQISIGILHGDTPESLSSQDQILDAVEYLLNSKKCPIDNADLEVQISKEKEYPYYSIRCKSKDSHLINIIISKDKLFEQPPDIILTSIDSLNYILLEPNRHKLLGKEQTLHGKKEPRLPPLLLAVDEPHVYTGVFGSNVSLVFRAFDYATQKYMGAQGYKPLKIATSATMPNAEEFLAKLFVEDANNVKVIYPTYSSNIQNDRKGFLAFLPGSSYGFQNATVEIIPLIAGLLPKELRKVLVFVDSIDFAETLKRYMEDYISKGLPDFKGCLHLLQNDVYDPKNGINPNAIKVAVHTGDLDEDLRREIEVGLRSSPPKYNIVIATPTLELGIDIGDITVVVIAGLPPTPEKFAQRAGRAGRRKKGLVVILGNNGSAVDRHYLSDDKKLIDYLQMSLGPSGNLKYMLPLNPLNLESTRRFFGNFIAIYGNIQGIPKVGLLRTQSTNILDDYVNLSASRISDKLSSFKTSEIVNSIASFAKTIKNDLKTEFMSRFKTIVDKYDKKYITHFVAPNEAKKAFTRGEVDFIPLLDNIRSTKKPVLIVYHDVAETNTDQTKRKEIETDIEKALASFAISKVKISKTSSTSTYFLSLKEGYYSKVAGRYISPLRGTLRYYSLEGESELFEVSGLYYNEYKPKHYDYQDFKNSIKKYVDDLGLLSKTSVLVDKKLYELYSENYREADITLARINNLLFTLNDFLEITSESDTHIVEPLAFHLTKASKLGIDKNNNNFIALLPSYQKRKSKKLPQQILIPLDYFEAIEYKSNNNRPKWIFSKITFIKCPNCGSLDSIKLIGYDHKGHKLEFSCGKCNMKFVLPDPNKGNISIHQLRTKPVVFSTLIRKASEKSSVTDTIITVSTPLRKLRVFTSNVGFRVSSVDNKKVSGFIKTELEGNREQYIVGTDYETQGIEIVIDWLKQNDMVQNLKSEIENEYKRLLESFPPNLNILNEFKIRVTHTLSHMIINFAPIYTGGNRWDVNEYLEFEDENGDIIRSKIVIFDADDGGNGVSELIRYFIEDILATALNESTKYYIKTKEKVIKFLGEPGITTFVVWPICPYGNTSLSRSLTLLYFKNLLGLSSIDDLQNIKPDDLQKIIGFEEEK